jgi:hypothetical protein
MRQITFVALFTVLAAVPAASDEGVRIRYTDPTSRLELRVEQDISVEGHPSIASRSLFFDLDLIQAEPSGIGVTIERAGGTYTAHGMDSRLSGRHLAGKTFTLSLGAEGEQVLSGGSPVLFVGPPVARGVPVAETFAETLPVLPRKPVIEGSTWTTQQPVHSLEGWSWGTGVLSGRHRVTSIRHRGGRRLVTVESTAEAELQPIEGSGFTGTIERSFNWTFDATSGRLVSLSMTQESTGISPVQQGDVRVNQVTTVKLGPVASG